jgi:hypothetical protein
VSDVCLLQRTRSRSNSSESIYTSFRIHEEPAQSFRPTGYRNEGRTARVYPVVGLIQLSVARPSIGLLPDPRG